MSSDALPRDAQIYTQPTGGVPLVGFSSTIPFWSKLLGWLGIHMHAEARNEYKSVVRRFAIAPSNTS